MRGKGLLLATVAGIAFTLAGAQPARADHRDRQQECWRNIQKQEHKLEKEIRKHGWYSRQARHQREKIARLRHECDGRYGWSRDRDWRDDDRWRRDRDGRDGGWGDDAWRRDDGHRRRYGRWDHDPFKCRHYNHRHDRDGGFRWGGSLWLRIR